ncbi:MAG: class I SAM-dependent methyltransferase [Nitrospirae bacterium]|nr:class I SAM-dependent methyltransferase [Nitrospirota bacterium]
MQDSENTTKALVGLYEHNDWLINLNFKLFMYLSGLQTQSRTSRVLDCGCAMGDFLKLLQRNGFINLCGVDASSEMLVHAKKKINAEMFCCDVLKMSELIVENSFDIITAMNIQHHIGYEEQWGLFVEQCRKILKPGGLLIMREPYPTLSFNVLRQMSNHRVFLNVNFLKKRIDSLIEERQLLDYFTNRWPSFYKGSLKRSGFNIVREVSLIGHRIVVSNLLRK